MGKERTEEEIAARKAKKERKKAEKAAEVEKREQEDKAKKEAAEAQREVQRFKSKRKFAVPHGFATLNQKLDPAKWCYDPDLREAWKGMTDEEKQKLRDEDRAAQEAALAAPPAPELPFESGLADHFETSPEACQHIAPLLSLLASELGKDDKKLRIYDPFYCAGAIKRHLGALGFGKVHNECEDFYDVYTRGAVPNHDVVVSTPPHAKEDNDEATHIERLLRFCCKKRRPFLLNMTDKVASHMYYKRRFSKSPAPLLLAPPVRYHWWTPLKMARLLSKRPKIDRELGVRVTPHCAVWYVSLEPVMTREDLMQRVAEQMPEVRVVMERKDKAATSEDAADSMEVQAPTETAGRCVLCPSVEKLPACYKVFRLGRDLEEKPVKQPKKRQHWKEKNSKKKEHQGEMKQKKGRKKTHQGDA